MKRERVEAIRTAGQAVIEAAICLRRDNPEKVSI
jgi:hypothetical protein